MAANRPFPPSPRRLALARSRRAARRERRSWSGPSPAAATVLAVVALGRVTAHSWAAGSPPRATAAPRRSRAPTGSLARSSRSRCPLLGAAAIAAVIAHLAQTRAVWLPRRRLANAPRLEPGRGTRASARPRCAAVIGAVAFGLAVADGASAGGAHVVAQAPPACSSRASPLHSRSPGSRSGPSTRSSSMPELTPFTPHDGGRQARRRSPGRRRPAVARPPRRASRTGRPCRDAVAGASLLLLGDGAAVAIAWDPIHRPMPVRTATGRAARATQLVGLARRHAIACSPRRGARRRARAMVRAPCPRPTGHGSPRSWPQPEAGVDDHRPSYHCVHVH